MSLHLPDDLERFVNEKVRSGRFASAQEAICEAIQLLRDQEDAEDARVLNGIRQGLDEMHAGKGRPADVVFEAIRRDFDLATDA
jgi:putative addiction module CopG family antidote